MMTIQQMLSVESDGDLLDIYLELNDYVMPETGYVRAFCRRANNMIDKGILCVNPTTYRKIYTPTLAKLVYKELADRYVSAMRSQ